MSLHHTWQPAGLQRERCRCHTGINLVVPQRLRVAHPSRLTVRSSHNPSPSSPQTDLPDPQGTLDSLDALLGQPSAQEPPKPQLPWWRIPPKQTAPPRQGLMTPTSQFGRFIVQEGLFSRHVRTGQPTLAGSPLDIPKVEPFACYLWVAAQAAVYAVAAWLAATSGPLASPAASLASTTADAASLGASLLSVALALHPADLQQQPWQLMTSLLVHSSAPHLVLDLLLLLLVAPEVESLFGHTLLLALCCFAGVVGGTAAVAAAGGGTPDGLALADASIATFGLVGAYLGYCIASPEVTKSSTGTTTSSSSSRPGLPPAAAGVGLAIAGVLLLSLAGNSPGISPAGHGGGLLAGCLFGYMLGPKFVVIQEVDIPEGSMMVPENAVETRVVMDQRSGSSRLLSALLCTVLAAVAVSKVLPQ